MKLLGNISTSKAQWFRIESKGLRRYQQMMRPYMWRWCRIHTINVRIKSIVAPVLRDGSCRYRCHGMECHGDGGRRCKTEDHLSRAEKIAVFTFLSYQTFLFLPSTWIGPCSEIYRPIIYICVSHLSIIVWAIDRNRDKNIEKLLFMKN